LEKETNKTILRQKEAFNEIVKNNAKTPEGAVMANPMGFNYLRHYNMRP
jgi:hypothetical protein